MSFESISEKVSPSFVKIVFESSITRFLFCGIFLISVFSVGCGRKMITTSRGNRPSSRARISMVSVCHSVGLAVFPTDAKSIILRFGSMPREAQNSSRVRRW